MVLGHISFKHVVFCKYYFLKHWTFLETEKVTIFLNWTSLKIPDWNSRKMYLWPYSILYVICIWYTRPYPGLVGKKPARWTSWRWCRWPWSAAPSSSGTRERRRSARTHLTLPNQPVITWPFSSWYRVRFPPSSRKISADQSLGKFVVCHQAYAVQ